MVKQTVRHLLALDYGLYHYLEIKVLISLFYHQSYQDETLWSYFAIFSFEIIADLNFRWHHFKPSTMKLKDVPQYNSFGLRLALVSWRMIFLLFLSGLYIFTYRLPKAPVKRSQLFMQQCATFVVKKKFVPFDHLVVCCCIMLRVVVSCCMKFARDQKCL